MFKVLLVGLYFVLQSFFVLVAQNYDDNFAKPIVTENGKFHYYELPAIKTSEGELIFLDRNLGALSEYVGTTDSWGDLYQWGRETDGHEKRTSDTTMSLAETYETGHARFIVDERKANDWLSNPDDELWKEEKARLEQAAAEAEAARLAEYNSEEARFERLRSGRDQRLAATDYLLMPDYPLSDDQRIILQVYRQALRDLPSQEGAPWDGGAEDTPWPEIPNWVKA